MAADSSESISHHSGESPRTDIEHQVRQQREKLALELKRVQLEARAARLEAKAAEIELTLNQIELPRLNEDPNAFASRLATKLLSIHQSEHEEDSDLSSPQVVRFNTWDDVATAQKRRNRAQDQSSGQSNSGERMSVLRLDSSEPAIRRPRLDAIPIEDSAVEDNIDIESTHTIDAVHQNEAIDDVCVEIERSHDFIESSLIEQNSEYIPEASLEVDDENDESIRRSKPAAWVVSAVVHFVVLVVLGLVTLQSHRPKDQVALSASVSESEESIESFSIESDSPTLEPVDPTEESESEVEYDLSPVGEISVAAFAPPPPQAPPNQALEMMKRTSTQAMKMMKSAKVDATTQFCGVDGGGNHFVYLVDSSKSMKEAFQSARRELIRSINLLKPKQRFYVIFYDSKPDYMRISSKSEDEPRSVYATSENKAALTRWAMSIQADFGKNPNEPLEFALGLRPDAIFLLSDGEFPQSTEDLLKEKNKYNSLFGNEGLISKVHPIAYHSRAGETRMRRIAEQNQGQYRYIKKP